MWSRPHCRRQQPHCLQNLQRGAAVAAVAALRKRRHRSGWKQKLQLQRGCRSSSRPAAALKYQQQHATALLVAAAAAAAMFAHPTVPAALAVFAAAAMLAKRRGLPSTEDGRNSGLPLLQIHENATSIATHPLAAAAAAAASSAIRMPTALVAAATLPVHRLRFPVAGWALASAASAVAAACPADPAGGHRLVGTAHRLRTLTAKSCVRLLGRQSMQIQHQRQRHRHRHRQCRPQDTNPTAALVLLAVVAEVAAAAVRSLAAAAAPTCLKGCSAALKSPCLLAECATSDLISCRGLWQSWEPLVLARRRCK